MRSESTRLIEEGSGAPEVHLLRTKIAPPVTSSGMLVRPSLVRRVSEWAGKLILISAPAGWGKSSLLASWYGDRDDRRYAFVRLEPSDDDPAIFWRYVIEALRTVFPDIAAGSEELLRSPEIEPTRQIVPALLNELVAQHEAVVLVLDDYHVVGESISRSVEFFIEHLPARCQVVVASRSDPPFPLNAMRAAGEVLEIRARDLGFDGPETTDFLRNRFDLEVPGEIAQRLCDRTEGWPAGLQLAGISMASVADVASFVDRFAGDDRNVAAYLVSEVLSTIPPERREFLQRTCVLDELSPSLCDAVAEGVGSDRVLRDLEGSGLFVIPLDTRREWYRYHHLFADWLRHELRREQPGLVPELHRRASDWYAQRGELESAIEHTFRAGDQEGALELLERYLGDWDSVQWSRVLRWMVNVEEESAARFPMIAVANVWFGLFAGDFPRGMRWLKVAEESIDSVPKESQATIRRYFQVFKGLAELTAGGDMDLARELCVEVADAERPNRSRLYVAAVGNAAVATFWTTGPLAAVPLLLEAQRARADASLADSGLTPLLALAHAELGSWAEAESAANLAFELPRPPPHFAYPDLMLAHFAAGTVLLARGERDAAISRIEQGLNLARTWPDPIGVAYGLLSMADARSDFQEKRALVREAREIVSGKWGRGRILDLVAAAEGRLDIRRPIGNTEGTVHAEALTERETDVLRRLRGDLSLREVAAEMYISHNTVKSYTKAIYRKLGVTSRTAAVEAAIELDLL